MTPKIEFNEKIQIIVFTKEKVLENATLTLTGFGKLGANKTSSDKLQTLDLRAIKNEDCNKAYDSDTDIVGGGHVCTLNKATEGACGGDSGGPLTLNKKLVAIVNAGIPCAVG